MMSNKYRKIIISVLLLTITAVYMLTACSYTAKDRSYKVKETYRLKSSEGSKSLLMVDLPVGYGYQHIDGLAVNNVDKYSFEEKNGYQVLHAEIVGDGNERTIEIEYTVELLSGEQTWDMEKVDEYLQPGENVDSDNESIIEAALSLKVENDDYLTAKRISAFVTKTVKADRTSKVNAVTLPASKILEQKKGVCNDYANLTAAMLRAAGIPARPVSGLVFNNLKEAGDWSHAANSGSHAWVEFYAGGKWHFADPTWGNGYFDKADGYHLSYGTELVDISMDEYKAQFDEISKSMENEGFKIVASMTAPLKFEVWSNDKDAMVIPKVVVDEIKAEN